MVERLSMLREMLSVAKDALHRIRDLNGAHGVEGAWEIAGGTLGLLATGREDV